MGTKRIVIVGGGFAGIQLAKRLANRAEVSVTLIDRRNYHLFQPLLYQVATAGLSPSEIAMPIRSIFSGQKNITVLLGEVTAIDRANQKVFTQDMAISYDYLVLACGATHSYFGHEEWEPVSPGLKTVEQAEEIRRRILLAFETAERETNETEKRALLTFVIIGGGPTGVELAGAVSEIARQTLYRDFRHVDPDQTRIFLIEAGPRVLPAFSESLSKRAKEDLIKLDVDVRTQTRVTNVDSQGVYCGDVFIPAKTVIWAAGVRPSPLAKTLNTDLDPVGRVRVTPYLQLPGDDRVFVLGDMACCRDQHGICLPGVAPVAMQQGQHTALNILRHARGQTLLPFRYKDTGIMATIGRKRAVAQIGRFEFTGTIAWLLWLLVHIVNLTGFRNRLFVFLDWAWAYLTFRKGARLILDRDWQEFHPGGK